MYIYVGDYPDSVNPQKGVRCPDSANNQKGNTQMFPTKKSKSLHLLPVKFSELFLTFQ